MMNLARLSWERTTGIDWIAEAKRKAPKWPRLSVARLHISHTIVVWAMFRGMKVGPSDCQNLDRDKGEARRPDS
jgi:hypothetical protein